MKFVNAIYAGENTLKRMWLLITALSLSVGTLFLTNMYLVFRDPLIIERACESKVLNIQPVAITRLETEAFIKESLGARFDSERDKPSLMTEAQASIKRKELSELTSRKITQVVFVDKIDLQSSGEFKAKLTRLLKMDKISTAIGFEIEAKIFETRRTEDNPYGLILSEVKLVQSEVK